MTLTTTTVEGIVNTRGLPFRICFTIFTKALRTETGTRKCNGNVIVEMWRNPGFLRFKISLVSFGEKKGKRLSAAVHDGAHAGKTFRVKVGQDPKAFLQRSSVRLLASRHSGGFELERKTVGG